MVCIKEHGFEMKPFQMIEHCLKHGFSIGPSQILLLLAALPQTSVKDGRCYVPEKDDRASQKDQDGQRR